MLLIRIEFYKKKWKNYINKQASCGKTQRLESFNKKLWSNTFIIKEKKTKQKHLDG